VTREDHTHASATTDMGHAHALAGPSARAERAERLQDYFDLQLRFAEAVATTAALPLAEAVAQCTNFYRRFGLGPLPGMPVSPEWHTYTAHLITLATHVQRVAWTQAFFVQVPPETLPPGQRQFGCFSCDPPDADGRVRIHFVNSDTDGMSPLSRTKIAIRKQELQALFTYVQHTYADAQSVRGGSWLYHLDAYRRLFPPVYGESRTVLTGMVRFQGSSSWG
jgi:hypothetical protein